MDIRKLGSGIWYIIHKEAIICQDKKSYINFIHRLKNSFPCEACKKHFTEYIEKNPIEQYLQVDKGLFIWTWKFHNSVNRRLGKPEMSYEDAEKMYTDGESNCNLCTNMFGLTIDEPRLEFYVPIKKKKQRFCLRDL
jgi:hypothetical protein